MTKVIGLKKITKLKALNRFISSRLYYNNPESPLRKGYRNSIHCQGVLTVNDGTITSAYCKNRWCPICNRNKTAELINKYLPTLDKEIELYFITLTRPNVSGDALKCEIEDILSILRKILNSYTSRKFINKGVIGIRKLECTYNAESNTFHPHFHLLVSDREFSKYIRDRWLKLNSTAKRIAQKVKKADGKKGTYLEIFKYFTKLLAKDKATNKVYFDPINMDIIFKAMKGHRVFQPIGKLKAIQDDSTTLKDKIFDKDGKVIESGRYQYFGNLETIGYYSIDDGSNLIEIKTPNLIKELDSNLNFKDNKKTP